MASQSVEQMRSASPFVRTQAKVNSFVHLWSASSSSFDVSKTARGEKQKAKMENPQVLTSVRAFRKRHQPGRQSHPGLPSFLQQTVERCQICHEDTGGPLCASREGPGEERGSDESER